MEVVLLPEAEADLVYWSKTANQPILKKIAQPIRAVTETPFEGIGKPEPLKHQLTGCWSRRINKQHRLVYEVLEDKILIHSARGHY